jgi:hypothetical protein
MLAIRHPPLTVILSRLNPSRGLESVGNQDQKGRDTAIGEILYGTTGTGAVVQQIRAEQPWCKHPAEPGFMYAGDEYHGIGDALVPGGGLAA